LNPSSLDRLKPGEAAVIGRKAMRASLWVAVVAAAVAAPARAQSRTMCGAEREAMAASAGMDVDSAVRAAGSRQGDPAAAARARAAYQENLRVRRLQAEQYAAAARSGVPLPPDAADTLRRELAADIEQWRAEFHVGRNEADAMRSEWLVERDSLSAVQWAQRRVDWWAARDAWVARHAR
jgi:hypothetical protein